MTPVPALKPAQLNTRTDPAQFTFATTAELEHISDIIGQERAVTAVEFGIGIRRPGYNIFALGGPGTGKHTVVRDYLTQQAADDPPPSDWCYVYNLRELHRPVALELPAGGGARLRKAMDELTAAGTRFDQCHVQHLVCTPSCCSLLTGWYPHMRGHRTLWHMLRPDEPNLLHHLKQEEEQ